MTSFDQRWRVLAGQARPALRRPSPGFRMPPVGQLRLRPASRSRWGVLAAAAAALYAIAGGLVLHEDNGLQAWRRLALPALTMPPLHVPALPPLPDLGALSGPLPDGAARYAGPS